MVVLALALSAVAVSARAADHAVSIKDFAFNPANLTIALGDSVTWTNNDPFTHTSTSNNGVWNSGPLGPGATFTFTFPDGGTFGYHCMIHPGMTATITVVGPATVPGPPQDLGAEPGTPTLGRIDVIWQAPVSDGGSPITGYEVCRNGSCFTVGNVTSIHDDGLTLLQTYTYTVKAINAVGAGPDSNTACTKPFPWLAQLGC